MKSQKRSCGTCTVCCEGWLVINVESVKSYPGNPCKYVLSGKGCGIYESRPCDPCRNFYCSWVADTEGKFPEWMKPKKSNAIVMQDKLPWNSKMLDLVVPVGPEIPHKTLTWLMEFARKHGRPFIYAEHKVKDGQLTGERDIKVYAPQPMRDNILAWLDAGNKFW